MDGNRTLKTWTTSVVLLFFWPLLIAQSIAADLTSRIVSRVIDGDTLVLDTGEKIRLAGISSPVLARENCPVEPLANEAKSTPEGLLVDGRAQVEVAQEAKDRYGRTLAYLFTLDGQSVQRQLLLDGLASVVGILPNGRYLMEYIAAEEKPRKLRRVIWSLSF